MSSTHATNSLGPGSPHPDFAELYCIYIQLYPTGKSGGNTIRILDTPRLHRQRKGRRRTVQVLNTEELAERFGFTPDVDVHQLERALHEANWPYHRDAAGRLWSVAPEKKDGTREEGK